MPDSLKSKKEWIPHLSILQILSRAPQAVLILLDYTFIFFINMCKRWPTFEGQINRFFIIIDDMKLKHIC